MTLVKEKVCLIKIRKLIDEIMDSKELTNSQMLKVVSTIKNNIVSESFFIRNR